LPSVKSINLEYNENDFTINFAALNFISPGNNKFKFKLEGAEENWHIEDHPKPASYYNLAPGKYKFTVLACNNDGIWNNDGAVLLINISPPWWKTWWFISFITLCVGLLVYSMITIRIKAINKQRLLLEKVVQRRTAELQTANSTLETLLYRTSHDIRGPVKSLIGLVNIGKDEFSSNEKYKIYLNHIMHSAQKLDNIVNELTLISNNSFANEVEFIDFEAIFEETKSSFQSIAGFSFFETSIQVDLFNKFLSNKKVIYSIFHNLIQNAFKYRDQAKKISYLNIHVSQSEKEVLIVFNDNGVGIEKNDLGKIFEMFFRGNVSSDGSGLGLFVVKSLVSKLGGSITVVSSIGVGSEFRLRLPLKH
jgi:signal transduction histidine kinase